MKPQWVTVTMNCHHTVDYEKRLAPQQGESAYCHRCADFQTVQLVSEHITIRCNKCRYSRSFGSDYLGAVRAAGRHVVTRASHKVMVKDGPHLKRVVSISTAQLAMGEYIRQSSVDNQAALRAFQDRLSGQQQD